MSNVNIKQVEGGETTSLADADGFEIDTGSASKWVKWGTIKQLSGSQIARNGAMVNGKISPTASAGNLTLAIKTLAGTDPSSTDPVVVILNGSARTITSALSLTIAAGANTCNLGAAETATLEQDLFAYLSWKASASAVVLLASRIPGARVYGDFDTTATGEKYAAYSAQPASTDDVCVIGRFAATLSAGAGYTWTVPTYTNSNLILEPVFESRWLDWSPTWTNVTIGNATVVAKYMMDKTVIRWRMEVILGNTSSIAGSVQFSVPFATSFTTSTPVAGSGYLLDSGTASYSSIPIFVSTTAIRPTINSYDPTLGALAYAKQAYATNTVPFTWTTSDAFQMFGSYTY
jgi:hypothetical protein